MYVTKNNLHKLFSGNTIGVVEILKNFLYHKEFFAFYIFHKNLPAEIYTDPAFVFRMWLIPKTANHEKSSDINIEFLQVDRLDPWQLEDLEKAIVAIRDKIVEVPNDSGKTHPYLRSQAFEALKQGLKDGESISIYDMQCVIEIHDVKSNPKFFHKASVKNAPSQYSHSFVEWLLQQYSVNPKFFAEAREKKRTGRN